MDQPEPRFGFALEEGPTAMRLVFGCSVFRDLLHALHALLVDVVKERALKIQAPDDAVDRQRQDTGSQHGKKDASGGVQLHGGAVGISGMG